ncbi:MAG: glycosyltransferase [Gammaproteobacteria bacterium]|nr:glycosyltransferase [Gammaproteobacteria bacterium]
MNLPVMKALLVIPCYNEAERLPVEDFLEFNAQHDDIGFLFVNDGSSDNTQGVLARLAARMPAHCSSLSLTRNRGKAEAVRAGMIQALTREVEYVGYWDADLSTPLDEIPRFMDRYRSMPDRVMLAGARVRLMGRTIERRAARHFLGRVFASAASLLLDIRLYDTQCGAKLLRCTPETGDLFLHPFHSRWLFDLELIMRIRQQEGTRRQLPVDSLVYEVPLNTWRDVSGSKISYPYFFWAFFDLLLLRLAYRH